MNCDRDTLQQIERKVGRPFAHEWEGDTCVAIDLTSEDHLIYGLIRRHSPVEKQEILSLICCLLGLRKLNLLRNRVGTLPAAFCGLTELEWLNLGSNDLGVSPPDLRSLQRLRYLHLGANGLTSTPAWIAGLAALEYIGLHKNVGIKSIEPLAALRRLRSVNLFFVSLGRTPAFIYEWKDLTNLVLWNCKDLTEDLARLVNLEVFTNCGTPGLHELPSSLTKLPRLRYLRAYQNSLQRLPEDLGNLHELEHISLYQNRLHRLPDSFAQLTRLRKLNLGWNRFEQVPSVLAALPALEWVGIFGNPLASFEGLPAKAITQRDWPLSTL